MKNSSQPLHLKPAASTCLKAYLTGSHLMAVVALYLTAIPAVSKGSLLVLIIFSGVRAWRTFVSCATENAVCYAVWMADDSWQITNGRGISHKAVDFNVLLCVPALTVLQFRFNERRTAVLLVCVDSVTPELGRQLRVRLYLYP